ncbi:MAG: hypothetical protein H7175_06115, partial [Burkholderiales bacterium]|nr:hypothetical protein [Anaerolineae bacterium]
MPRRLAILCAVLFLVALFSTTTAQDALNLPADLYVLLNEGHVERYGTGAMGVRTVTPEDEFVLDFGVAPDGNWLAYRTQEALFITDLHSGYSTALDTDADFPATRGEGDTVAWSP